MNKEKILKRFSFLLLTSGGAIIFLTFFPVVLQEGQYQIRQFSLSSTSLSFDKNGPNQSTIVAKNKEITPLSLEFSLVVPKIGINALVFPQIDASNEKEYLPVLKKGVAQAKGSALPNQPGTVFVFAHSTDSFFNITHYNAVFFLLNKLQGGDDLYLFYQQKKYHYQVSEKKIVNPEDIPSQVKNISGNALVLQTCWPPGTTLKRLIVISKLLN